MALSGIVESLENKSILVTGCTGFLAKVFVEKVLRIQPHLKRLFVLLRAVPLQCSASMMKYAYVAVEKEGLIQEKPLIMGEAQNKNLKLDIEAEVKLVQERLNEINVKGVNQAAQRAAMKELGLERARIFGWPNTYVFTKAMGEMLIGNFRESLPLVIVRPTIITSTYKDPFPGWIEGIR
ncbi:putative oxidoreductase [Cinnamomum micranthum f. kanehirae]|uniref:Fatty acyl-CoA reductase n=1 Tax=Cinnamomum micranthum f. kanehirae TaxID=337451 RepID=A0A443P1W5_9MAGN|nr:putative oxidoreductase [Cinnamomum micranthum f. kanehirae]